MKFSSTLIAVNDMTASLQFYKELFNQDVIVDLGWNKTLSCGLVLQEHFDQIAEFPQDSMKYCSNTMELYFETEDFEGFMALLDQHPEVKKLHEAKEFPWLQKGIHIYDPDGHIIEISESMYSVACRQFEKGKNLEETAKLVQHPLNVVQEWYAEYREHIKEKLSVCGTNCFTCYCYGNMCNGCNESAGKVFYVPDGKTCAIYECARNNKGFTNCGRCQNAPCEIWMKTRDPKFSDGEFAENVKNRMEALK